jgi:hypothetical protein
MNATIPWVWDKMISTDLSCDIYHQENWRNAWYLLKVQSWKPDPINTCYSKIFLAQENDKLS